MKVYTFSSSLNRMLRMGITRVKENMLNTADSTFISTEPNTYFL